MKNVISKTMMIAAAGFLVASPVFAGGMGHDCSTKGEHSADCTKSCCKKDKANCTHTDKAECEKAGCHKHGNTTQNFGPKKRS